MLQLCYFRNNCIHNSVYSKKKILLIKQILKRIEVKIIKNESEIIKNKKIIHFCNCKYF